MGEGADKRRVDGLACLDAHEGVQPIADRIGIAPRALGQAVATTRRPAP